MYDKLIDLTARDGYKLVGSYIKKIIGSGQEISEMQPRIRDARESGMTRIEISFYFDNTDAHKFRRTGMQDLFCRNASNLLNMIASDVLSYYPNILVRAYKSLSIYNLVNALGQVKNISLVIGAKNVWLVNCSTNHTGHFIGTNRAINLQ